MRQKPIPAIWSPDDIDAPIVFASLGNLKKIVEERTHQAFVWPDEGNFDESGKWTFNEAHAGKFEPLLIDALTANAVCLVHEALNAKNQDTIIQWVARHRGEFAAIVEFSWAHVSFKKPVAA